MARNPENVASAETWAVIGEAAKSKLAGAPVRSFTALIQENLESIERRLSRGWTHAQIVRDLTEAGAVMSIPVFKNTLYRVRQRRKADLRKLDHPPRALGQSRVTPVASAFESPGPGPSRYTPPTTGIRWDED